MIKVALSEKNNFLMGRRKGNSLIGDQLTSEESEFYLVRMVVGRLGIHHLLVSVRFGDH